MSTSNQEKVSGLHPYSIFRKPKPKSESKKELESESIPKIMIVDIGKDAYFMEYNPNMTVKIFKEKIAQKKGIPAENQILMSIDGVLLKDSEKLGEIHLAILLHSSKISQKKSDRLSKIQSEESSCVSENPGLRF